MNPGSIRARLLLWSAGLTVAALVLAWVAISGLLADFIDRRLAAELTAGARAVMAATEWTLLGEFTIAPPPADSRFERPLSGWYWQVADGAEVLARSPSLVTGDLGLDGGSVAGPDGSPLTTHLQRFTAPGDGRALIVTVTLPSAEAAAEIGAVQRPLSAALAMLGLALIVAQGVAVRLGLLDLTRFARAVAAVRDGQTNAVSSPTAKELRPLAAELNRLIAANAAQVDRVRAHAGDLAHALKTPLAVLSNRARPEDAALIDCMDRTIRWHLKRARATGAGLDPKAHCAVGSVLDDIVMVLTPEARRRDVDLVLCAGDLPDFAGDAEDLAEIVGALAENAVQWARSEVRLSARPMASGMLAIEITDDGPGIPEADRDRLMKRGERLDEASSGHGLGLAIAADRARFYGGSVALDAAPEGGLLARVILPAR
jgi:signal transduction histidine kinase